MLLRASGIAVVLLLVFAAYSKPPHDTMSAGANARVSGGAAQALSIEQAQCEQRQPSTASKASRSPPETAS